MAGPARSDTEQIVENLGALAWEYRAECVVSAVLLVGWTVATAVVGGLERAIGLRTDGPWAALIGLVIIALSVVLVLRISVSRRVLLALLAVSRIRRRVRRAIQRLDLRSFNGSTVKVKTIRATSSGWLLRARIPRGARLDELVAECDTVAAELRAHKVEITRTQHDAGLIEIRVHDVEPFTSPNAAGQQ